MKDDAISRRAAIDNLKRHLNETDVPDHYPGIFNAIEEWLDDWEVPSAQPEIIYCKDCINWINKHLCEIWSRYGTIETKPDFYCGNGQKEVKKHE